MPDVKTVKFVKCQSYIPISTYVYTPVCCGVQAVSILSPPYGRYVRVRQSKQLWGHLGLAQCSRCFGLNFD